MELGTFAATVAYQHHMTMGTKSELLPNAAHAVASKHWVVSSAVVAAAALLSAVQIWARQALDVDLSGASSLLWLLATNLIAWAPWVPLGLVTAHVSRVGRRKSRRHLWTQVAMSQAVVWSFLVYLSAFRAVFLPEIAAPYLAQGWLQLVAREASEFYGTCLVLYAGIAVWAAAAPATAEGARPGEDLERSEANRPTATACHIEVRSVSRTRWIPVREIEWLEAAGNYVRLHTTGGSLLHRDSLKSLVGQLEGEGFVRVHRSSAVRLDRVQTLEPLSRGDGDLTLQNGDTLRVSRRYRDDLLQALRVHGLRAAAPDQRADSHSSRRESRSAHGA